MKTALFRLAIALMASVPFAVLAAPDDLDRAFGDGGIARITGAKSVHEAALFADGGLAVIVDGDVAMDNRVLRLDIAGRIDAAFAPILRVNAYANIQGIAVAQDDRLVVVHYAFGAPICFLSIARHLPTGVHDPAFGQSGIFDLGGARCSASTDIAISPSNEALFARSSAIVGASAFFTTSVARVNATGTRAESIAGATFVNDSPQWSFGRIAMQPDGRPVLVRHETRDGFRVVRLVDTLPDPGFGNAGTAFVATPLSSVPHDVAVGPDGGIIVVGAVFLPSSRQVAIARFTQTGQADLSFGSGGLAYVEVERLGEQLTSARVAIQRDGKIVVAGTVEKAMPSGSTFSRIAIARLSSNGRLDTRFAPGGVTTVWRDSGSAASFLLLRNDGRIIVGGSTYTSYPLWSPADVFQLNGGDDAIDRPLRERKAIEYFHADYGHYFVTADAEEIAALDTAPASGWIRTGRTMRVWDDDDPTLVPMCRFWSNQTWAPKSSHFYTPFDSECATVKNDPAWRFERGAFKVRLPEGTFGGRTCGAESSPLYRAYNNGRTGAPNHRYMTDVALLDEMIAQGWTMEGEAQTRVFACVPAQ